LAARTEHHDDAGARHDDADSLRGGKEGAHIK
jgi:hypothetical protein